MVSPKQMVDTRPLLSSSRSIDGIDAESYGHDDQHSSGDDTQVTIKAPLKECILMFIASAGCMMCVTAILSNLVYYTDTMGSNSFFIFNLVLYGPMLPITIFQTLYDGTFDQMNGSLVTYSFRGTFGFFVSFICLLIVPSISKHKSQLVELSMVCLCLGTASAVLHGTLKQMASFVYPNCGRLAAAVAAGMQASALPVLVVSVLSRFGDGPSKDGMHLFYGLITAILLVCWGCFRILLYDSRSVRKSMQRRDSYLSLNESQSEYIIDGPVDENNGIIRNESDEGCNLNIENGFQTQNISSRQEEGRPLDNVDKYGDSTYNISTWEIWEKSRSACSVIIISVASSMSVSSYFNNIESQYPNHQSFPQVIFYTRLLGDLLGRPATLYYAPKSMKVVTVMANIRLFFVPVFFTYTSTANLIPKNDLAAIVGVFAFAFTSGYLVTLSYQIAPSLLVQLSRDHTSHHGESDDAHNSSRVDRNKTFALLTRQAGLINVCFSISVMVGFALTFVIGSIIP